MTVAIKYKNEIIHPNNCIVNFVIKNQVDAFNDMKHNE